MRNARASLIGAGLMALAWLLAPLVAPLAGSMCLPVGIDVPDLYAQGSPDLIVQSVTFDPANPDIGEGVDINVVVKNHGDAAASGFYIHMYVDPADQPPTTSTPYTTRTFYGLPLNPNASFQWQRGDQVFDQYGRHLVYVWVDRDNAVAESDEGNNLVSETVTVTAECEIDLFENDNTCASAVGLLSSVVTQTHTFCPMGDEDWGKFEAIQGVTYDIAAVNLGADSDPILSLYDECGGVAQFGTGGQIHWTASDSGVYYVKAAPRQGIYGSSASFDLVMASSGGTDDIYEPDDTCNMARDVVLGGETQIRFFSKPDDQDWVRFFVESGRSFALSFSSSFPGVVPNAALFGSCKGSQGNPITEGLEIQWAAERDAIYYARVNNQNHTIFGPEARYDLSSTGVSCQSDGYEPDNDTFHATVATVGEAASTHDICPAGDEDWMKFQTQGGQIYELRTSNLGVDADTNLVLYDTDGVKELARNDDYGYGKASRIVWKAAQAGDYYAKIAHYDSQVSGIDTHYDFSINAGRCVPDVYDQALSADNKPSTAITLTIDASAQQHNLCPDPIVADYADEDWLKFLAQVGQQYWIKTSDLGNNCDTVLYLYDNDGTTVLASNDDYGNGFASIISFTAPVSNTYYARVTLSNTNEGGNETDYRISVSSTGETPPPVVTPTPPPPVDLPPENTVTAVKTLILVAQQRMEVVHGESDALMSKLDQLAAHSEVKGLVVRIQNDPAVADAYTSWTVSQTSLLNNDKANAVASSIRNLVMSLLDTYAGVQHVVIVGSDSVIPFRRVPDGNLDMKEQEYAPSVTANTTTASALQENMILTDDYYVDEELKQWGENESYIPDYAIGRLVEAPDEIMGVINAFLVDSQLDTNQALITGYDFAADGASNITAILVNDGISVDSTLIGNSWTAIDLRSKQLHASPRFDIQSVNGHALHTASKAPDSSLLTAQEVVDSEGNLEGSLVLNLGCHSGLGDEGRLDLPQAYAQKKSYYIGNTGFGWGSTGVRYSEAIMSYYIRKLMTGTSKEVGVALLEAKKKYRDITTGSLLDAKVVMQTTLYGLPMYRVTSGGTLGPDDDPFPSANISRSVPSLSSLSVTEEGNLLVGHLDYTLEGYFEDNYTSDGIYMSLDGNVICSAGEPIQPSVYADISAPPAISLHGMVLTCALYADQSEFDPVVALPLNEYILSTEEPFLAQSGWYPAIPFQIQSREVGQTDDETVVVSLGQYNSELGVDRVYSRTSFDTYYSGIPDVEPAAIAHVDGILDRVSGTGVIKVKATDSCGVARVLIAYTSGQGIWDSQDMSYCNTDDLWAGSIPATTETYYFVQVVDRAGNVAFSSAKGKYHSLLVPLPSVGEPGQSPMIFLPVVVRGDGD